MQTGQFLTELLGFGRIITSVLQPLLLISILIFLLVPRDGSKKELEQHSDAIFGHCMLVVGVILMSITAIPTLMAVVSPIAFEPHEYLGLLLIFAAGGIVYLWVDQHLRTLNAAVLKMPSVVYKMTIKFIGSVSLLYSAISLSLAIAFQATHAAGWWSLSFVSFFYGGILCWFTSKDAARVFAAVQSNLQPEVKKATPQKKKAAKK